MMALTVLVGFAPQAAAVMYQRTWTNDTDFNEAGHAYTNTELIGTGVPAKVELVKGNTDWANKNPSAPTPGPLESGSTAFSAYDNVVVLFGGYDGSYRDTTWEYDFALNSWTEITTTPKPPGRQSAGLSFDPVQNVIVMYGGFDDASFRTDTWEYTVASNTWAQVSPPTSPPPMADTPLVYDSVAQRHVLFGMNLATQNMETWAYDASANTWSNRNAGGTPSGRSGFAMAYHAERDRTVVFGGAFFMTQYSETWEYNYGGNSWTQIAITGPSARSGHAMTYRSQSSSALLFGGFAGSVYSQETWRYFTDPDSGPTWQPVSTVTKPPGRQYTALAHDTQNDATVLYGGQDSGGNRLEDTWALSSAYWAAGKYASAVFDTAGFPIYGALWWNKTPADQPTNTFLRFQVATSTISSPPTWNWQGPTGPASYYTSVNMNITTGDGERYFRFLADFGSLDTQVTPSLEDVTLDYWIPPAPPCLTGTDPADLSFTVPVGKVVRLTFSKAMDTNSLVVTFVLGPPVTFQPSWSSGDTIVDLNHIQPFAEAKAYRLQIAASDKAGAPLASTCPGGSPAAPNPFTFVTEAVYPTITKATPPQSYMFYNLSKPMYVEFSEGMNTSSLIVTITPDLPGGFTRTWSNGDANVTLSHTTPFTQCIEYQVNVSATDKAGLSVIPGLVPNPWTFVSECINPYIKTTNPGNYDINVATSAPIVIDFIEPMLTSSVVVTIQPSISMTWTWTGGNMKLTGTHTQAFPQCTPYKVTVTGTDPQGNQLIAGPPSAAKNPWKFMTQCPNPFLMITIPEDGAVNVTSTQDVTIVFSEEMDTTSVQWTFTPSVSQLPPEWNVNQMLVIHTTGFMQCIHYTVQVTSGRSSTGASLVPGLAPNPFSFDIVCNAPYVTNTDPVNASTLVANTASITVDFNKPMDTGSMFFGLNPAGVPLTPTWSNGDQRVVLTHATPFADGTMYTAFVDGNSKDGYAMVSGYGAPGAPNPWVFTTRAIVANPYIVLTDPADQQQGVLTTKSILVTFSEPINPSTFQVTINPPVALNPTWSGGNSVVTLDHTAAYPECTWHTVTISAKDVDGNSLINITGSKPNPWQFRTRCVPPQILSTNPIDGATGVPQSSPIVVTFSHAMNPTSVTWTINPTIPLTPGWTSGNTVLTLTHATPFLGGTLYTVTIYGNDADGTPLAPGPVPNPWSFTTASGLPAPTGLQVIRSLPDDIVLSWQQVLGAASYRVYGSVSRFTAWPWPILRDDVSGTTYTATGHLSDGSPHYYIVVAKDPLGLLSGNSTMGAKVPLSFSYSSTRANVYWMSIPYRSMYKKASDIANELGPDNSKIDVIGKWNPATQTSILYYWARNKWRGTDFVLNPGDGFFVGVRSSFQWNVNGTDGSVLRVFQWYPAPNANANWISLPYTSVYTKASDIVMDIEGSLGPTANTKITEVGRWDPTTQTLMKFTWTPTGWSGGTDFNLVTGEGLYLKVVSGFQWTPRLITMEVP